MTSLNDDDIRTLGRAQLRSQGGAAAADADQDDADADDADADDADEGDVVDDADTVDPDTGPLDAES